MFTNFLIVFSLVMLFLHIFLASRLINLKFGFNKLKTDYDVLLSESDIYLAELRGLRSANQLLVSDNQLLVCNLEYLLEQATSDKSKTDVSASLSYNLGRIHAYIHALEFIDKSIACKYYHLIDSNND